MSYGYPTRAKRRRYDEYGSSVSREWNYEDEREAWPVEEYDRGGSDHHYYEEDQSELYHKGSRHEDYYDERPEPYYEQERPYVEKPHHEPYREYDHHDSMHNENYLYEERSEVFPKRRVHVTERVSGFDRNLKPSVKPPIYQRPQRGVAVILRHVKGHIGRLYSFDPAERLYRNLERYGSVNWAKKKVDGTACLIRFREVSAADALFNDTKFLSRWGLSLHYFSDLLKSGEETQDSKFTLLMRPTVDGKMPEQIMSFWKDINEKRVLYLGFREKADAFLLSLRTVTKKTEKLKGVTRICLGKNRHCASITFNSEESALEAIEDLNDKPFQKNGPEMRVRLMENKEEAILDKEFIEDFKPDVNKSGSYPVVYCGIIDDQKDQFNLESDSLYKAFIPYGTIIRIILGESNKFAHISFKSAVSAKKAIDGQNLKFLSEDNEGPIVKVYIIEDKASRHEETMKAVSLPKPPPEPAINLYCYVCERKDFPSIQMYNNHLVSLRHTNYLRMRSSKNRATLGLLRASADLADKIVADRIKYKAKGFTKHVGKTAERIAYESLMSSTKCSMCKFITKRDDEYLSHLCSLNHLKACDEAGIKEESEELNESNFDDVEKELLDAKKIAALCPLSLDNPPIYDKNECFGLEFLERKKEFVCEPCRVTIKFHNFHSHSKTLAHFTAVMDCLKRKNLMKTDDEQKDFGSLPDEKDADKISNSDNQEKINIENSKDSQKDVSDADEPEIKTYDETGELEMSDLEKCFYEEVDMDDGYEKDWMDSFKLEGEGSETGDTDDELKEVGEELENLFEENSLDYECDDEGNEGVDDKDTEKTSARTNVKEDKEVTNKDTTRRILKKNLVKKSEVDDLSGKNKVGKSLNGIAPKNKEKVLSFKAKKILTNDTASSKQKKIEKPVAITSSAETLNKSVNDILLKGKEDEKTVGKITTIKKKIKNTTDNIPSSVKNVAKSEDSSINGILTKEKTVKTLVKKVETPKGDILTSKKDMNKILSTKQTLNQLNTGEESIKNQVSENAPIMDTIKIENVNKIEVKSRRISVKIKRLSMQELTGKDSSKPDLAKIEAKEDEEIEEKEENDLVYDDHCILDEINESHGDSTIEESLNQGDDTFQGIESKGDSILTCESSNVSSNLSTSEPSPSPKKSPIKGRPKSKIPKAETVLETPVPIKRTKLRRSNISINENEVEQGQKSVETKSDDDNKNEESDKGDEDEKEVDSPTNKGLRRKIRIVSISTPSRVSKRRKI